jgi:hypothetical protein
MGADAKRTVLRMIPYGIYVLAADDGKGNIAAARRGGPGATHIASPHLTSPPGRASEGAEGGRLGRGA